MGHTVGLSNTSALQPRPTQQEPLTALCLGFPFATVEEHPGAFLSAPPGPQSAFVFQHKAPSVIFVLHGKAGASSLHCVPASEIVVIQPTSKSEPQSAH